MRPLASVNQFVKLSPSMLVCKVPVLACLRERHPSLLSRTIAPLESAVPLELLSRIREGACTKDEGARFAVLAPRAHFRFVLKYLIQTRFS